MIGFPNAKINIGLYVTEKRLDGFHNIETVFLPVDWKDVLEFVEAPEMELTTSGLKLDGRPDENLVMKAYQVLNADFKLPRLHVHLHKIIPFGAGLGGGSSDAAFMLSMLNEKYELGLSAEKLETYAAEVGSDCPFFLRNQAVFAMGKGEIMEPTNIHLKGLHLLIVKPSVEVNTKLAYENMVPAKRRISLKALIRFPVHRWTGNIVNQFEPTVFQNYPELKEIKQLLYDKGAVYASMSGSGSSIYGIFSRVPSNIQSYFPKDCIFYTQSF